MNKYIIEKNKLKFVVVDLLGERWKHCSAEDDTIQKTLGCFLSCWQKPDRVGDLLKEIEALLNGQLVDAATSCESVLIDIYKDKTEFFDACSESNFRKPDFIMSTADFKAVLAEWKEFLGTPASKKLPVLHSVWL